MMLGTKTGFDLGVVLGTTGNRAISRLSSMVLAGSRSKAGRATAASSIGGLVKIAVGETLLVGTLVELVEDRERPGFTVAQIEYIGEGMRGQDGNLANFSRGITQYPHPGDAVAFVSDSDLKQMFSPHGVPHIQIGTVYPTADVRAPILFDRLLSRHFAVVGSSGTGKSTMVALMLSRIIEAAPHSHIVILDPHGEYARAFGDKAQIWNVKNLKIPYWFMNLAEHCETFVASQGDSRTIDSNIMAKCLLGARLKSRGVRDSLRVTADSPVSYHLEDLLGALQEEAGRLVKPAEAHHYTHLQLTIEQFFEDERYRFIFNPDLWTAALPELIGDLLRIPGDGKPISIIDLAGVPSEIVSVVVSTLSRLIFDYAVWVPREQRTPILLVCEEAHRYLPQIRPVWEGSAERQLDRIAREGRKYGICLGLITQRPSELSETALSQCGTVISMRLNNQRDQDQVKAILSEGARSFIDMVPALQNQECIISGEGVPVPMHVRIDSLERELTPASDDPEFSQRWNETAKGHEVLLESVRRWMGEG